jgi:hypothetical protein
MPSPRLKIENISMRISSETKEYFEELFQESGASSKGEFLKVLMDRYSIPEEEVIIPRDNKNKPETIEVEKIVEVEKVVEVERPLKENEIVINLNKLQFTMLEWLTTKNQCRKSMNADIENINNGVDKTFWGNKMYSGRYKDLFINYTCEDSPEKVKEDIGAHLVNVFMVMIAKGYYEPVGVNADYIHRLRKDIESNDISEFVPENK